jgi:ABC-type antimicrobial peptide transport system permease subunit
LPGVTAVSVSNGVPVDTPFNWALDPPDGALISETRPIDWRYVTPGYFDVFQVRTLAGRAFVDTDRAGAEPVAIVNDAFARAYFGSSLDAVGRTLRLVASTQDPARRIVGVVADTKSRSGTGWTRSLTAMGGPAAPIVFVPAEQASPTMVRSTHAAFPATWSVRTAGAGPGLERSFADAVRAVEPRLSFIRFEAMDAIIARDLDQPRFVASLLAAFAALAMALAAIGLYGVMSYASSQRLREVGIRMAFGATAGLVWRRFVSEGVAIAAAGLAIGLVGAVALTRSIEVYLFGIARLDPATYAGVAAGLLLIAAVASSVPAVRAARVDPATSLRAD